MRYVLGPSFAAIAAPAPIDPDKVDAFAPVLVDVEVSLKGVDAVAWTATIGIPAYDPASHHKLNEIRVYLAPQGSALPADAPGWVTSAFAVQVADVAGVVDGADAAIPLPVVAAGDYFGQIVLTMSE